MISSVLVLRGPVDKPVVDVAPDWESYEYKQINLAEREQKSFFEAALAWELGIDRKKWKNASCLPFHV